MQKYSSTCVILCFGLLLAAGFHRAGRAVGVSLVSALAVVRVFCPAVSLRRFSGGLENPAWFGTTTASLHKARLPGKVGI
jgi:hypothetical protein